MSTAAYWNWLKSDTSLATHQMSTFTSAELHADAVIPILRSRLKRVAFGLNLKNSRIASQ